jgi:hypothetical protein
MKKLFAPITVALGFLGVLLTGFLVSAHAAQGVAPEDGNLLDLARPIFDEIMKGHYIAAAALALVLSVALLKRYAPGKIGEFVHSDAGGSLTTLLMSMGGALATATAGGAAWSWGMLWTALIVGVAAMGGYTAIKRLVIEPFLRPLMAKAPSWMQPAFGLVMWIFDKKFQSDPVKEAQVAGDVAVAANPATGASGVVGEAKDL